MGYLETFLLDIKTAFLPEIIIFGFIIINILLTLFCNKKYYKLSQWIAILGILTAFASIGFIQAEPTYYAFFNNLAENIYTVFFKSLILIASFFTVLNSYKVVRQKKGRSFIYFLVMFGAILASLLLISANNLLFIFLANGLLGISNTILLVTTKNYSAKESALKYFGGMIVAFGLYLFGTSYIYGICGDVDLGCISAFLTNYQGSMLLAAAVLLITAALLYNVFAAPFLNYVPDVFKGASYPVGMFLSLIPVISGFAVLVKVLSVFKNYVPFFDIIMITIALLTIAYGAYGACRQTDIKRFMGYGGIVHSGFMVMVTGILSPYSLAGLLYYLISYLFINVAMWAGITMFYDATGRSDIESYRGLAYNNPFYTTVMVFVLVALAGLPPTSGFLAKFFVFSSVARLGFIYVGFLLIAMILNVVSVGFYLKPMKIMFEKTSETLSLVNKRVFSKFSLYFCAGITLLLFVASDKIAEFCELIAYSF